MHFFNPPDKMPLVEIVRGPATSDRAIATVARLAVELGKFPVVVADRPGFLVNRCLAPYLAEAGQLLVEGVEPEALDGVLCQFGFPMGPARLLDEIGWDIALRVAETLSEAYGERMQGSELATAMVAAGQLGTKSGGGLYRNGKPNAAGRKVLVALRRSATRRPGVGPEQVLDRCLLPMLAEAARCLDEGIVESAVQLDLGMVMGVGFPPFRGGPIQHGTELGWKQIVERLDELARTVGPRLSPPDSMRRLAMGR
jgi:3-hydroxyacyl-CoA dehydrogenase/enoyl-CoA hydratase/3-hydroxybutyryl-CoA epimerase